MTTRERSVTPIALAPEHEAWLSDHVANGEFASVDEAIRQLIDARMAEEQDDLAWAKPAVTEALQAVRRGETGPLEEHRRRNAARLDALKD